MKIAVKIYHNPTAPVMNWFGRAWWMRYLRDWLANFSKYTLPPSIVVEANRTQNTKAFFSLRTHCYTNSSLRFSSYYFLADSEVA